MIANKIKALREKKGLTQNKLADKVGTTRASVNAWEMGLSVPSTPYIGELAKIFGVSTDYILGINSSSALDTTGLNDKDIEVLNTLIAHLKASHKNN